MSNTPNLIVLFSVGTYQIQDVELVKNVLDYALAAGYRNIGMNVFVTILNTYFIQFYTTDSAAAYKNEEQIGKALKELLPKYNLTRKDIFITTKLRMYYFNNLCPLLLCHPHISSSNWSRRKGLCGTRNIFEKIRLWIHWSLFDSLARSLWS